MQKIRKTRTIENKNTENKTLVSLTIDTFLKEQISN